MQYIAKKLRKDNGESLAEVFVAILISAVGMLMLSSLIYAASNIIEKGDVRIKEIYNGVNVMEEKKDNPIINQELIISDSNRSVQVTIDVYHDEKSDLMSYKKHEVSK